MDRRVNEIAPGIWHWSAVHPRIKQTVHSHWIEPARTVLDPIEPPAELPGGAPERIVLTCRHHLRDSRELCARREMPILANEAGLHEFRDGGPDVQPFVPGEQVAPGITVHEVGSLSPDDSALLIEHGGGALALADAVVRWDGELKFVPDFLMGDDPEGVKEGLRAAIERLLELDFRHLLLAHGDPSADRGKEELRQFLERGTPSADFG
jgi:hypothetical protein